MLYVKVTENNTVYPYTVRQLREDNPGTSFPDIIPDERLADWGVYPVTPVASPAYNYAVNLADTVQLINGVWTQVWVESPATQQEIDDRLQDKWASIREERNQLLYNCDWTQLPDAPVNSLAWATYRQELRDITTQQDPYNIVWPTPPTN